MGGESLTTKKQMANQWFKFYGGEYLSDPKMLQLNAVERSCWLTLLCLASQSEVGEIKFLSESQLFVLSGVHDSNISVLKKFEELDMIKICNGVVTLINWEKRQYSEGYSRVKNFRKRKSNGEDNDRREENRREENILPDWLDKKTWENWVEYRKEKKKSLTQRSIELQLKELAQSIPTHKAIIEQSIRNGWTGLFPLKEEPKKYNGPPERKYKPDPPKVELTPEEEAEKKKGLAMLRDTFTLKK